MVTDPIGDMLIQIKNAGMAGKPVVELPFSKIKHEVAKILVTEGYITSSKIVGDEKNPKLRLLLKYEIGKSVIHGVKRVSKPGMRWYVDHYDIPTILGGMGMAILSTPQGCMTGKYAKQKGIGGELLCEIW